MTIEECFDTDFIELHFKRYCPYCGNEIKATEVIDGRESFSVYQCSCEDAINAYKTNLEIERLKRTLPIKKYYIGEALLKR